MKFIASLAIAAACFASLPASALSIADQYGSAIPASAGVNQRRVSIDAKLRYVNVNRGDVVSFSDGKTMLTWVFDGVSTSFPLSTIFPGMGAERIEVYVQPDNLG